LPLFVFNKDQLVTNASDAAITYCKIESSTLFGKPLFESLNLEFPTDFTLESWITECQQHKVIDHAYWERVRIRLPSDTTDIRQCDMAAYYNRDNPSGTEFIVTLFDRTEQYNEDDSSLGFVALAVHELRTPLTVLRGYIEVFEEELRGTLDPQLADFLKKMEVSAKQLTAFVNNMLNVARVDENELTLHLVEENWESVVRSSTHDIELRAQIHGIDIEYNIAPDLPTVAVDRVSIYEVINNLLDNAIKYSGTSKKIFVMSKLNKDRLVETVIQDFGVGMPSNVLPKLFEKFHRNHRNKGQIAGTGLGLFLSKAIVSAHGGNIWAESKEGEGSTFGFTILPYANLSQELKDNANTEITRSAHGWVKNHSLYRR
jgi:signal transduction histidine kinase